MRLDYYNMYIGRKFFFLWSFTSVCSIAKMWKIEIEAIVEQALFNFGIMLVYTMSTAYTLVNIEFLVVIDISLKLNVIVRRL